MASTFSSPKSRHRGGTALLSDGLEGVTMVPTMIQDPRSPHEVGTVDVSNRGANHPSSLTTTPAVPCNGSSTTPSSASSSNPPSSQTTHPISPEVVVALKSSDPSSSIDKSRWRILFQSLLVIATQIVFPIINSGTDFSSAITVSRRSGCIRNNVNSLEDHQHKQSGLLFLDTIVTCLWVSSAVGLLFNGYYLYRCVTAILYDHVPLHLYDDEVTGHIKTHRCNRYKTYKICSMLGEDVVQLVCNLLIAVYVTGYATFNVTKVVLSAVALSRGFSRITTHCIPWHHYQAHKCCTPRTLSRSQWAAACALFLACLACLLSPIWESMTVYDDMAVKAKDAMFRFDAPAPVTALSDAFAALSEAHALRFSIRMQVCLHGAGGLVCTPPWTSNFQGSVSTAMLPFDAVSYNLLLRNATRWHEYSGGNGSAVSVAAPQELVQLALRVRSTAIYATLTESSGSQGLTFLPLTTIVRAARSGEPPANTDITQPNSNQRRGTMHVPFCGVAPCWNNFSLPANLTSIVMAPRLAGAEVGVLFETWGICDDS